MKCIKLVTLLLIVVGGMSCNQPSKNNNQTAAAEITTGEIIKLSKDKKTILQGETVILKIDDAAIFNWFKIESGLCHKSNNVNENRNLFCNDAASFFSKTSFVNIYPSKNKKYIAVKISSKEMPPDAVIGFYNIEQKKMNWLTRYYLGNQFLGYSPNESKFIYKNSCWEALCGLTIKSTSDLSTIKEINNPKYVDERGSDAIFNKWIDNNTINYTLKNFMGSKEYTESF